MEEISTENLAEVEQKYRRAATIIFVQIAAMILIVAAIYFFAPESENQISGQSLTILWAAIVFVALAAFILRRMFFRWDRLRDIALLKGIKGLVGTLQTNAIILSAFAEIIVVIGAAIAIFGGAKTDIFRAALVSLILFLINFPRKSVWRKIVAGLQNL